MVKLEILSCQSGFRGSPTIHFPNISASFFTGTEVCHKGGGGGILGNKVINPHAKAAAVSAVMILSYFAGFAKINIGVRCHILFSFAITKVIQINDNTK